jgi:hypothetical protein
MTLNPTAVVTARRNVVDRIGRFLRGLGTVQRQPTPTELFWLRRALVNLQEGQYRDGEDAMARAERATAIPERATDGVSTKAEMTAEQNRRLWRSELAQIEAAPGFEEWRRPMVLPLRVGQPLTPNLHALFHSKLALGVECKCGRRVLVDQAKVGARDGCMTELRLLKLKCLACGSGQPSFGSSRMRARCVPGRSRRTGQERGSDRRCDGRPVERRCGRALGEALPLHRQTGTTFLRGRNPAAHRHCPKEMRFPHSLRSASSELTPEACV